MTSKILLTTRTAEIGDNYDAQWNIHYPRLNNMESYVLSLRSLQVPNIVYPINQYNNRIVFYEAGAPLVEIVATLTPQGYTGAELATEIATQMSAAPSVVGTYTCAYDSQTKKLTIAETAGPTAFYFADGLNTAYDELGLDLSAGVVSSGATSHVSTSPINVSGTTYIDVITSFGTLNYSHGPKQAQIFARIPMTVGFGTVFFYEAKFDDPLEISSNEIRDVRISVRDDKGNPWKLPSNAYMSLEFGVTVA